MCHACRQKYGVDPIKGSREALLLVCADFAIEPPQPMPPHVKMVGGILTAPAKPLPADLEARTPMLCFRVLGFSTMQILHAVPHVTLTCLFSENLRPLWVQLEQGTLTTCSPCFAGFHDGQRGGGRGSGSIWHPCGQGYAPACLLLAADRVNRSLCAPLGDFTLTCSKLFKWRVTA